MCYEKSMRNKNANNVRCVMKIKFNSSIQKM